MGSRAAGVKRSLVIAPQWIGDAVMSEPLLAALAVRGERLTVGALPWVAPVYRAVEGVAEIIELPFAHGRLDWKARWKLASGLRGRFDAAYVLPNSLKAALLPFLARIPRRVGYLGESRYGLLNRRLANPDGRPPMVAFYGALAGDAVPVRAPRLRIASGEMGAVLAPLGLQASGYFVLAPGAEYGPSKRWPPEHYAALAGRLQREHALPILLIGSSKERELCDGIAAAAGGDCRVLAGSTSLDQAMALVAGSRGVVSNDSGLMHVAAAFERPQVALFGSTSPEHTPPLNAYAKVLWMRDALALDCIPCFERSCRYGHHRCLVELPVEQAEAALRQALALPAAT